MLNNEQINYFSWSTHFDATVVIDNCVYPNRYNVNVTFLPKVKEIKTQNLAFEKVKYLFHRLCENSIIFNPKDQTQSIWFKMPINKLLIPGSPYDQLLGIVLHRKIVSIVGDFFEIGDLTVDSKLGDNVQYTVDEESIENKHLDVSEWIDASIDTPWWNRDDTSTFDQKIDAKKYWQGAVSWKDLGYDSEAKDDKSFKPTIIDGGREK